MVCVFFFFFLSDGSFDMYFKIINRYEFLKRDTKKKKARKVKGREKGYTNYHSKSIWSNHMSLMIFNIFTTVPFSTVTQKLKTNPDIFSKYST